MKCLATLVFSAPLLAQSFQIVPSTAPHGGAGSLLITLNSPAGKEPLGLQWKLLLGTGVTAALQDIVAGGAATAAGKAVTCAPGDKIAPDGSTYNCILIGGEKHIASGTIFLVKYRIKPAATPQTLVVRITDGLAILGHATDLQQVSIPPAEGTITVR